MQKKEENKERTCICCKPIYIYKYPAGCREVWKARE